MNMAHPETLPHLPGNSILHQIFATCECLHLQALAQHQKPALRALRWRKSGISSKIIG
jgi:hypothetical protein